MPKKCMKGGVVSLETLVPRNGRTDQEYAEYLDGRRLPPPFQLWGFPGRMGQTNNPRGYINRMGRFLRDHVHNSPINDHPMSPNLPRSPTSPSRRRRNKTKSSPIKRKSKSKRSDMKLAIKGTYKRRRASAPVKGSMSSRKAKNLIRHYKRTKKKSHKK